MKNKTVRMLDQLIENYPDIYYLREELIKIIEEILIRLKRGGKILICGNGGSAADSEHIVGELVKSFYRKRPVDEGFEKKLKDLYEDDGKKMAGWLEEGIKAISLVSQTSLISAYTNDVNSDMVYAQQVYVYGEENDILIGITTSGNSRNIIYAAKIAQAKNIFTLGLTGKSGGKLKRYCDGLINVPSSETYRIQEYHLPIYHLICRALENEMFGEEE